MSRQTQWRLQKRRFNFAANLLDGRKIWQIGNAQVDIFVRQDWRKATGQAITLNVVELAEPNSAKSILEVVQDALAQLCDGNVKWLFAKLSVGHRFERMAVVRKGFRDAAEG